MSNPLIHVDPDGEQVWEPGQPAEPWLPPNNPHFPGLPTPPGRPPLPDPISPEVGEAYVGAIHNAGHVCNFASNVAWHGMVAEANTIAELIDILLHVASMVPDGTEIPAWPGGYVPTSHGPYYVPEFDPNVVIAVLSNLENGPIGRWMDDELDAQRRALRYWEEHGFEGLRCECE